MNPTDAPDRPGGAPRRERERLEVAHRLLVDAVARLAASDAWRAMLDVAARFHRYSARNVLLLIAQGATGHVAGYRTWQRIPAQGGGTCQVRRGATGMVILAPCHRAVTPRADLPPPDEPGAGGAALVLTGFRPITVFDETALAQPPALPDVGPTLLEGHAPEATRHALVRYLETEGFPVVTYDTSPANGMTTFDPRAILVRPGLSPLQELKTLTHEAGHALLHRPEHLQSRAPRETKEIEAESVAYLVGHHLGLDTAAYSVPYVARWAGGNPQAVLARADRVVGAARRITAALDTTLARPAPGTDQPAPAGRIPPDLAHRLAGLRTPLPPRRPPAPTIA